jgi:hypothetical protein
LLSASSTKQVVIMKFLFQAILAIVLLVGFIPNAQAGSNQPVYIYLYARVTDHVNLDITEARLRRVLPMVERYRKQHPDAHVAATILFSGAVSSALAERNAQTGIKDFVLDYVRRGVIEVGYDGSDEPTYDQRPLADLTNASSPDQRWLARADAAEKFLTEARDNTGFTVPGTAGGLKKMQEVFGEAACITGLTGQLGGDSEFVQRIANLNTKAIMFGIPDPDPRRHIHGYRGSAMELGKLLSPIPESSPELFWQDNVLRSSETSSEDIRLVQGDEDSVVIKSLLDKLDRSKVRILHAEIGSESIYFRASPWYPPLKFAYENPEEPQLPSTIVRRAEDVDAAYAKEEAFIKFLLENFIPANPGSRIVSSSELAGMTPPSTGYRLSVSSLRDTLPRILQVWGINTFPPPPEYFRVDGHYLSLADMFQVLSDSLAELYLKGKLPESVTVVKVYGPLEMVGDQGPAQGEVQVSSIGQVCVSISTRIHHSGKNPIPIPNAMIPTKLQVEGIEVNAAQFLRLMAEALVTPNPETKIKIKMTQMFAGPGEVYPRMRPRSDEGAAWTLKPAPIEGTRNFGRAVIDPGNEGGATITGLNR